MLRVLARGSSTGLITVEKAAEILGTSRRSTALRLARLARHGWLVRVRRGYYLILALEAGAESSTTVEDPWILASEIYAPCYIGGWSAAEYWGLTEQLFRSTFVVTAANVRRTSERIANIDFRIVRVSKSRIASTTPIWRGAVQVPVSDREKTIADALVSPDWVGGVRHLVDILGTYFAGDKQLIENLLKQMQENDRGAAYKRIGYLIDELWPNQVELSRTAFKNKTTGNVKLDPNVQSKGRLNKKWGVWGNVAIGSKNMP